LIYLERKEEDWLKKKGKENDHKVKILNNTAAIFFNINWDMV
jgi:hypothetical protein